MKQRKGDLWIFGSHSLTKEETGELRRACTNARATLASEAKNYTREAQLRLHPLPSCEAVPRFDHLVELGKRVTAIIRITCQDRLPRAKR